MNETRHDIHIGTILLERNRWASPKTPSYRVSEWVERFRRAGFDGMELWEYHATGWPPGEAAALAALGFPVAVYNTYCGFEDGADAERRAAAWMARRLGAGGVKFNVGRDPARRDEYLRNLRSWAASFDEGTRLLCECHGGTIVETPTAASRFFEEPQGGRFEVIVHCFGPDLAVLRSWLRRFGPAVTHAHVALRGPDGRPARLDRDPGHVGEALRVLRAEGFAGSFALEFTEGVRAPDENIEDLWRAALADLRFLRERLP